MGALSTPAYACYAALLLSIFPVLSLPQAVTVSDHLMVNRIAAAAAAADATVSASFDAEYDNGFGWLVDATPRFFTLL